MTLVFGLLLVAVPLAISGLLNPSWPLSPRGRAACSSSTPRVRWTRDAATRAPTSVFRGGRPAPDDGDRRRNRTDRRPGRFFDPLLLSGVLPPRVTIELTTDDRVDVVDVTSDVAAAVPDELRAGVCTVFVPHTTAGVVVNENERRLVDDVERLLERVVPRDEDYRHDEIDDNADAHLRATLLGSSTSIPVDDGELALGTWQSVLFVECDGPRTRRLRVATTPTAEG